MRDGPDWQEPACASRIVGERARRRYKIQKGFSRGQKGRQQRASGEKESLSDRCGESAWAWFGDGGSQIGRGKKLTGLRTEGGLGWEGGTGGFSQDRKVNV